MQPDAEGDTWLAFTPTKTGCYQFSSDSYHSLTYCGAGKDEDRSVDTMIPLEKDVTVYLKTLSRYNSIITVKEIETQIWDSDNDSIEVSASYNAPVWVEYTPETTGMYMFSSTGSFSYYGEDTKNYTNGTSQSKLLNEDKPVYMYVTSDMTMNVQAINSNELIVGSKDITIGSDQVSWLKFTPDSDGLYTISTVSTYFYYGGEDAVLSSSSDRSYDRLLKQGKTVYMKVTGTANTTVTFTVKKHEVDELSLSEKPIAIDSDGVKWLSYTPSEDGLYAIGAVISSSQKPFYYYGEDVAKSASSNSSWTMSLKKDITVYMKVLGKDTIPIFTVTKIDPLPLSVGDTSVTIGSDGVSWLTFTPEKDGMYTFSVENNTSYYYYGEEVNAGSSGWSRTSDTILLDKGKTVYLKASGTVGATQKFTVDGVEFVELTAGTDSDEVELATGKYQLYQFTAAEAGRYEITQRDSSVDLYLYTNRDDVAGSSLVPKTNAHMLSMNEGDTVYFMAKNDQTETASVTVKVTKGETGADIAITEGSSYVQPNTSGVTWLTFTAEEAGVYSFSYSGNSSIYYYGQDKSSSTYSYVNGQPIDLDANDTVYLKFVSNNYDSTITVEKITFTELTVDTPVTTSIPAGGDSWFVFTAPEDGTYKFYSSNVEGIADLDTYGVLYNKDSKDVARDDDSNSNDSGHFSIEYDLKAGETVYLDTYHYNHNNTSKKTYIVNVEKVDSTETTE